MIYLCLLNYEHRVERDPMVETSAKTMDRTIHDIQRGDISYAICQWPLNVTIKYTPPKLIYLKIYHCNFSTLISLLFFFNINKKYS